MVASCIDLTKWLPGARVLPAPHSTVICSPPFSPSKIATPISDVTVMLPDYQNEIAKFKRTIGLTRFFGFMNLCEKARIGAMDIGVSCSLQKWCFLHGKK